MKTLRKIGLALVLLLSAANAAPNAKDSQPAIPGYTTEQIAAIKADPSTKTGTWVLGRPGFVYSPFAAKSQLVDVNGTAPGVIVKCPYTNKLFRVPEPSTMINETLPNPGTATGKAPAENGKALYTQHADPIQPVPPAKSASPTPTKPVAQPTATQDAKGPTPDKKPAAKPATKPEASKTDAKDTAGKPAAGKPESGKPKTLNPATTGKDKKDEESKPATVPVRMLGLADAKMLAHLFVKGRPLVWIEQNPNEEGRQKLLILEKREGDDVAVVFDWTCTTGRNLPEEAGNSFPTPSTFDHQGNIGAVKIIRKDMIREGSGLEWALELEFYDVNDNLRGICIHKGTERFYPASHACIRLNDSAARRVFNTMEVGDPVVITGSATVNNPYVTYVAVPGKTQKVPVFKIDLPMPKQEEDAAGYAAFQNDLAEFKALLRLPPDDAKKMQLDHMPFGIESKDKNVIRFRFEHMPRGTGITMAKVEKLLNMEMYVGPMVKRPTVKVEKKK